MPPYFITLLTMENTKSAAKTPTTIQPASTPSAFAASKAFFAVSGNAAFACAAKASGGGCYNSQFCAVFTAGVNKFHDIFLQKVFGGNGWRVFQTTAEHPKISLSKIR
ncbi:hypothetical protein, partial [Pseudomonas sp. UM16]|uniref:hypothetical protein n=1 Tax=Pseudomonas sp. UM16 TaxID=3158962 RepID=UPI003D001E15